MWMTAGYFYFTFLTDVTVTQKKPPNSQNIHLSNTFCTKSDDILFPITENKANGSSLYKLLHNKESEVSL